MIALGAISSTGETRTARFELCFSEAPDAVWNALTDPAALAAWLARATIEPWVGGSAAFDFGEHGVCDGTVTAWELARVLGYGWRFPDGPDSHVRWTLTGAEGGGTAVVLEHAQLPADRAPGYAAGWHAYLDRLEAYLAEESLPDWMERLDALLPSYEELAVQA